MPLDYNPKEERYNWDLIFCELYAGGKYHTNEGKNYEFSLGLNGLGACATQYSSEYMDVKVCTGGNCYELHFERGENIGGLKKKPADYCHTGTIIHWKPDNKVFTDINVSSDYFHNILKRQAVVNKGLKFIFTDEISNATTTYIYPEGIEGYVKEIAQGEEFTDVLSKKTFRFSIKQDKETLTTVTFQKLEPFSVLCCSFKND